MAAVASRATGLAIKYGARWLARTAVRRGVRSAAGIAARSRLRAASESRGYWSAVERGLNRVAGVGLGTAAAAGVALAYLSWRKKRPAPSSADSVDILEPASKRPKMSGSNGQSHGILKRRAVVGRREPYARKMRKIQKSSERALVFAFRGINPMSAVTGSNSGWFNLWQGGYTGPNLGVNLQCFPVDVYNLTAVPQGGVINADGYIDFDYTAAVTSVKTGVIVPWKLCQNTATNNMNWYYGRPGESNGATEPRTWTPEKVTNFNIAPGGTIPVPGHSSYLDWVRARFMIYGRKKEESRVRVQLVQFTRDEFCPEYDYVENDAGTNADERLRLNNVSQNFVKGLVNNPISTKSNTTKEPFFRVLYSKYIAIPPKQTDDENDDPLKVQFDLFKRMNKLIRYDQPTNAVENNNQLNNEQYIAAPSAAFRSQPTRLRDNVYLMISSWDPRTTGVPSTDYQTSYDLNLRKRHTVELT